MGRVSFGEGEVGGGGARAASPNVLEQRRSTIGSIFPNQGAEPQDLGQLYFDETSMDEFIIDLQILRKIMQTSQRCCHLGLGLSRRRR